MTDVSLTPFQELEAMLLFGTENPITTIGEVEEHLRQARHSLMISRINGHVGELALFKLLDGVCDKFGPGSEEAVILKGAIQHMDELVAIEVLATERDIMVMESFILFMSSIGSSQE